MRQFIASAVIAAVVFSAAAPTFAQRSPRITRPVNTTTKAPASAPSTGGFADFEKITAESAGSGAVVSWTMRSETQVAFYQVYRLDPKQGRIAVGAPVVGSAGKTNYDTVWGESYSITDPDGTTDSAYEVEATNFKTNATQTSGQVTATSQKGSALTVQAAELDAARRGESSTVQVTGPAGVSSAPSAAPDLARQRQIAAQRGAKISVRKDGMYRVYRSELAAVNFFSIPGSSSSANWRLYLEGNEQAIIVGANDQYIEFFGRATDTPESDTRVYYLIVDTTTPGLRMSTRVMRSFGGTALQSTFKSVSAVRERTLYYSKFFNGDASNYYGTLVTSSLGTRNFYLANVDTTSQDNATLNVRFQGYSNTAHEIKVTWNGHLLSPPYVTGAYQDNYAAEFTVPMSWFNDGLNTLQLQTTSGSDYSVFDTLTVGYAQKFRGYQNEARVATAGRRKVAIDGFTAPSTAMVFIPVTLQPGPAATRTTPNAQIPGAGVLRLTPTVVAGTQVSLVPGQVPLRVARIPVSRVFGTTGEVSVNLNFADGTAVGGSQCGSGADYVIPSNPTVTLPDGVIAKDVDVTICSGTVTDPNGESFSVSLSNPVGAPLATSNVRLFDLSYDAPQVVSGATPTANGNNYGVIVPAYRQADLYAIDESYELQAAALTENFPSTLSAAPTTANMLIISHPSLMSVANDWANYRRSPAGGQLTVQVIDVDDIYDEYNYGTLSANAIKTFLNFAYNAIATRPNYVMLMGDASYDPRNYEGRSFQMNLVPTKLVDLAFDEAPSDDALVDFNNDGLLEIPIGRIPASSPAVASLLLQRTQTQETAAMQAFSRGAVFVNDNPYGYDFLGINQSLRNELPPDMPATYVSRGNDPSNATQDPNSLSNLISTLNTGPYIVNYAGHGASGLWGSSNWFTNNQVPQITGGNRGIYTMLTCLNGRFNSPLTFDNNTRTEIEVNSLAESLIKNSGGGASISWASTTETTADIQQVMGRRFYNQLNAGNMKRIGDLVKDAKGYVSNGNDVLYSWVLLGDPATKLRP